MKSMMKIATTACLGVHGAQGLMLKRSQVAAVDEPMAQVSSVDRDAAVKELLGVWAGNFTEDQIRDAFEQCNWESADAATEHLVNPVQSEPATINERLLAMGYGEERIRDVLAMHPGAQIEDLVQLLMTMAEREDAATRSDATLELEEDAHLDAETQAAIDRVLAEQLAEQFQAEEHAEHQQEPQVVTDMGGMPVVTATQVFPAGHGAHAATAVAEGVPIMQGSTTPPMQDFQGRGTAAIEPRNAAANAAPVSAGQLTSVFGGQGGEVNVVQQRRSSGGRGRGFSVKMQMPAALKGLGAKLTSAAGRGSSSTRTGTSAPLLGDDHSGVVYQHL